MSLTKAALRSYAYMLNEALAPKGIYAGTVTINGAKNIRRWGATKGLGQLATGPTTNTVADDYGTVRVAPIVQIAVTGGW